MDNAKKTNVTEYLLEAPFTQEYPRSYIKFWSDGIEKILYINTSKIPSSSFDEILQSIKMELRAERLDLYRESSPKDTEFVEKI